MADREKILRYYKGTEGAETAAKLLDLAEFVHKNHKYKVTDFLDPYGYTVAETVAAAYEKLHILSDGGYIGAERQRIAFVHEDFMGKVDFAIQAVKISWNEQYYRLTHRDVLGALMGLGIDRSVLGDLILRQNQCRALTTNTMAEFMREQLTSVGAAQVTIELCELTEIEPREEKCKEIKATVASLRLDSVAAAGFSSSRSKIVDDIAADKVKLNWQAAKGGSQTVKEGDIISMRGRGRVEVSEIRGQTKKGRIGLLLKRYI